MRKDFYLHKEGAIWYVRFRDPVTGEVLSKRSSGEKNKTAAEKWARAELPKLAAPDVTFREWAEPFFGEKCPRVSRARIENRPYAERTRLQNRRILETFVLSDPFADLKLADIRRSDILAFRERIVAKIGRRRSAQQVMAVLQAVLREAVFHEVIGRDPCVGIAKIAYEAKVRSTIAPEAMKAVLDPRRYENRTHWEATLCAALTGLRAGEVRGLQWGDLEGGIIHVRRAISQDTGEATLPKWRKLRTCPYPAELAKVLEPRRGEPGEWVFHFRNAPLGYRWWAEAVRKAAVDADGNKIPGVSLHALRHTLNTLLREAGVSDELLRGSFGWSGPAIHENYTHRDKYDYSAQAAMVDELLGGIHEGNRRDDSGND